MLHLHRKKSPGIDYGARRLKTKLLLLFGLLLLSQSLLAQPRDINLFDHDSKPYYFGITLGVNLARFQTELHPRFLQDDSVYVAEPINSGGFTLGLSATARLSDRFEFRVNPQLMFIERNISYKLKYPDFDGQKDISKTIESVIMTFPFQIKFNSDRINNFRVYMMTGVKADIDMASNARAKRADDLVKIDKYDYGIELGVGFNFFFQSFIFSPEIKISNGLRNIHSRDENLKFSSVFDRIQSRMIVFSIHLEG
ncbi:MAG: outer membrane beta-barrel protein [Bacteroidota bacterium]